MRSLEMHIWGKNGWVQGSLAVQKSPLLKSRVLQLSDCVWGNRWMDFFIGLFFGHWNWGHGEVLWYVCLRKSNSDVFFFTENFWGSFLGSTECRGSCRSQLDYQQPLSKCILHAYSGFVPRFWPLIRPTNSCIVIYMWRPPREQRFSWTGGQIRGTCFFRPISRWLKDSAPPYVGRCFKLQKSWWHHFPTNKKSFWIFFLPLPSTRPESKLRTARIAF